MSAHSARSEADPIARLEQAGEKLPPALRARILELGVEAVPRLIALLEDDELASEESPGGGYAPIHAVDLLVELGAPEAIEPLLRVLQDTSWENILHDRILLRLPNLGRSVLEPALAALELAPDDEAREALGWVLASLELRDERIWRVVSDFFARDTVGGANMLASYGDARALPLLERAIAEFEPDWDANSPLFELNELLDAYGELGGVLSGELREQIEAMLQEVEAAVPPGGDVCAPHVAAPKVGRNDACPCGSGKKYKKCCSA